MSSEAVYKAGDTGTVKVGRNTITVRIVAKDAGGGRVRAEVRARRLQG